MAIEIEKASIRYCPFYCEENIWHLAQRTEFARHDPQVVFISNLHRLVHFEAQRICDGKGFICWDYQVILIARFEDEWFVFDPDSVLPWGAKVQEYLARSFPFGDSIPEAPCFRVIEAMEFIRGFSSDRRHMHGQDRSIQEPPPPWPEIHADKGTAFNLWKFVDMDCAGMGDVLDLLQFRGRYGGAAAAKESG